MLDEAKQLATEVGYLPCSADLYLMNRGALASRIAKVGGFPLVQQLANISGKPKKASKWNAQRLRSELAEISDGSGVMPSLTKLTKLQRFDLIGAVQKAGGYRKVASDFGLQNERPVEFENSATLDQYRDALVPLLLNGKVPPLIDIKKSGLTGLYRAILNYGGIVSLAIALDMELAYPIYVDKSYVKYIGGRIIRQVGHLPSQKLIRELGYDTWRQAVNRHYGGLKAFASELSVSFYPERTSKK